MTAKETERLAKVEQKVDDLKESTDAGFAELKKSIVDNNKALNVKLDAFIKHSDETYITVAQAKVAIWIAGFLISVSTLAVLIYNAVHGARG